MTEKQTVKSILFKQADVNYTTVSPETGSRQCANCRFYSPAHMEYEEGGSHMEMCSCAIVEGWPLAIMPTGMCDRHELMPVDQSDPLEVVIVDIETESDEEMAYASPKAVQPTIWRRLLRQDAPPALTFFKAESGARRMLIITSNGYEDRENEHVATAALADYVKSSYDNDEYVGNNRLLFYHKSVLDIGKIISADMIEGFLVEVAEERTDSPIAKMLWDYIETSAGEGVQWGASHGFRAKRQGNTYVRIKKHETTVLDVSDAANWYTFAGVIA